MKDTVLTARRKKIEIITLLVCFVLANLVNLYAIIAYNRSMMEMRYDPNDNLYFLYNHICFCSLCLLDASAPPFLWSEGVIGKEEKQTVRQS